MSKIVQFKEDESFYKGEIIDMSSFQKKSTSNKTSKDNRIYENNRSAKIDDLLSKIENIDERLEQICSDHFDETREENSINSDEKNENDAKKNTKFLKLYNDHPFSFSVTASIAATLLISIISIVYNNFVLFPNHINSRLDSIETELNNFNTSNVQNTNNTDNSESEILERIKKLEINVATIANVAGIDLYANLKYTDLFIAELSTKSEYTENEYHTSAPPCQNKDIIAIDNKSGEKYTKEQLIGEKLLIPYTYNGQEVLFYGQYDDDYNWNKDCIINVYENNKLVLISETMYNNGNPLSAKLVYPLKTKENVWCITNREYNKNFNNIDETWSYFEVNENPKNFDLENSTIDDLRYVSQFENDIKNSSLEGYYCDKIDGNNKISYMIKNDENRFIRTLYIGKFKDGDFHDKTGNAQEIVFDGSVNKYFYYAGTFTEGKRDGDDNDLRYVTQEEINSIIEPYYFNCELNWHDTTKGTD